MFKEAVFTADVLICHCSNSPGVSNDINIGSVLSKCPTDLYQWDNELHLGRGLKLNWVLIYHEITNRGDLGLS